MPKKQLPKYRSKLEARVALGLTEWGYESEKMKYTIHKTYNPDFIKGNIYIEVKGFFRSGDTQKYKAIHDQMLKEGKVFAFVWSKPHHKIRRGSKLTNAGWCDKHGIKWFAQDDMKALNKWSKTVNG
jgi:hypothetical protein|tara:strand:+ start:9961 stop:10341 length:381 start_codon:yes stop_codon:yes gene_type:complete